MAAPPIRPAPPDPACAGSRTYRAAPPQVRSEPIPDVDREPSVDDHAHQAADLAPGAPRRRSREHFRVVHPCARTYFPATTDPAVILTIAATFLLAGAVKGVIGLGLPTVSLGILTAALHLPTAMALLIVPSFVTNVFQASVGGNAGVVFTRIWPFLLMATRTVWIGASALTRIDLDLLSSLLGFLLIAYATINLVGLRPVISAGNEAWAGPAFGVANGILTGMTGSFVVPGDMFLQGIGLSRDMLIQAMGMLFAASTVALALALQHNELLTGAQSVASSLALAPAIIGMLAGQAISGPNLSTRTAPSRG